MEHLDPGCLPDEHGHIDCPSCARAASARRAIEALSGKDNSFQIAFDRLVQERSDLIAENAELEARLNTASTWSDMATSEANRVMEERDDARRMLAQEQRQLAQACQKIQDLQKEAQGLPTVYATEEGLWVHVQANGRQASVRFWPRDAVVGIVDCCLEDAWRYLAARRGLKVTVSTATGVRGFKTLPEPGQGPSEP